MCTALPALSHETTMLQVSACSEQLGGKTFSEMIVRWGNDWRGFMADIEANEHETKLDQWEFQMQSKVLARIGIERLWFVSDGIAPDVQKKIGVTPVLGPGNAPARAQRAIHDFVAANPDAHIGVIPAGPYTLLRT